jgi:hypothetical protein
VGVLWHPEEGEDFALFDALVAQAREYRNRRGSELSSRDAPERDNSRARVTSGPDPPPAHARA